MIYWVLIGLVICCVYLDGSPANNPFNFEYGPYDIEWNEVKQCIGTKSKNLTHIDVALGHPNNIYLLYSNSTFLYDSTLDEIKVAIYSNKANKSNALWNYRIKKPCTHFAFAFMLLQQLNVQLRTCTVKKGFYLSVVDVTDATKTFFGSSFFYGEFKFKVLMSSKKGNVFCMSLIGTVVKHEEVKNAMKKSNQM